MWGYPRLKFHVHVVNDYADTQILNFAIQHLCKHKKVSKTVLALRR